MQYNNIMISIYAGTMYCLFEWASLEGQCSAYPDKTRTRNIIIQRRSNARRHIKVYT